MTGHERAGGFNERLERAERENPFADVYARYDGADLESPEVLDALFLDLYESKGLNELRQRLADTAPRFTSVYRYDPFSVIQTPSERHFNGALTQGAKEATARIFQDLTPEKVQLWRTDNEVLILIDHPSRVVHQGHASYHKEPTVLFSSGQLPMRGTYRARSVEESQIGLVVNYGDTPIQSQPPRELMTSSLKEYYAAVTFAAVKDGVIPRAFPPKSPEKTQE